MKKIPHEMLGFFRQIIESRTVLFPNIQDKSACRAAEAYLAAPRELGEWAVE
jgi:hypothetical protein